MNRKDLLRKHDRFETVDPKSLDSGPEWVEYLQALLRADLIFHRGEWRVLEKKHLVSRISAGNLKVEIFSPEHAPPHFHVTSRAGLNASFSIENCEHLAGAVERKQEAAIRKWYQDAKQMLIDKWNETRPANCVVGEFVPSS